MEITALDIVDKAIELGFDKCGIIPLEMMQEIDFRRKADHKFIQK